MRVCMKTTSAGPEGVRKPGQIVDVPDDEAQALVAGGYADPADADAVDGFVHGTAEAEQAKADAKAAAKAREEAETKAKADAEAKAREEAEAAAKAEADAKASADKTASTGGAPETAATRTGRAR